MSSSSDVWERQQLTSRLTGWRSGNGTDILLIHGVGLRAEAWRHVVPGLTGPFRITAVDLPGHGESPRLPGDHPALDVYVDVVADLLDRPTIVVGHSMGALIALDLAVRHPNSVRGVVAVNAIHRRSPEAAQAVEARAALLEHGGVADPTSTLARWFGESPQGRYRDFAQACRRWLTQVDPSGYRSAYRAFAGADSPADEHLAHLATPALFVTGSDEPNSTPAMSRALADLVPDGRTIIRPGARHMLPMTDGPALAHHIAAFARAVGAHPNPATD